MLCRLLLFTARYMADMIMMMETAAMPYSAPLLDVGFCAIVVGVVVAGCVGSNSATVRSTPMLNDTKQAVALIVPFVIGCHVPFTNRYGDTSLEGMLQL